LNAPTPFLFFLDFFHNLWQNIICKEKQRLFNKRKRNPYANRGKDEHEPKGQNLSIKGEKMKTKKLNKRFDLKKTTVVNLDKSQMSNVHGGDAASALTNCVYCVYENSWCACQVDDTTLYFLPF
jgi:hypothetical protein